MGKARGEGQAEGERRAGDQPGADYYETDVTLEELIDIMFEDLELPDLERKALRQLEALAVQQAQGLPRRSASASASTSAAPSRQRVKRKLAAQRRLGTSTTRTHRRRSRRRPTTARERASPSTTTTSSTVTSRPTSASESNAVVMCIMDTSGSMDTMKKYLARSFFFLLYQFICTKYRNVEIVFIAHHTEANEVTEEEFFHKGESGGTFISSGLPEGARHHPGALPPVALEHLRVPLLGRRQLRLRQPAGAHAPPSELADVCNLFGYGEIKPLGSRYYESSMLNIFRRLDAENFQTVLIERKEDIWPSLQGVPRARTAGSRD